MDIRTVLTSYSGDVYEKVETNLATRYHRLQMSPGYVKKEPERFTCECGFSWEKGKSGRHDCIPRYREQLKALTADLTSYKEEIERLSETANSVGILHVELSKMNLALTTERKETERLRGVLEDLAFNARRKVTRAVLFWKVEQALAVPKPE
jgi:hypothetical protein